MTNILWLGEIAENWNKKRIKDVTEINISNKTKKDDEEITFLPMTFVNSDGSYNINNKKKTKEYSNGFTYFEKNDIILAKITPCFENKKSAVLDLLETEKGYGSTEFHVFRTNKHFFNKFMLYIFKTDAFIDFGVSNFKGSAGHKRVPFEIINSMEVPTPTIKEQKLIANYLEEKTTSIDNSIETLKLQKERLIEQKKAIIHKAVTKGLDDSVEMKDSGVEWIGEIPKHWIIRNLKDFYIFNMGNTILKEDLVEKSDGKFPVYSATAEDKYFGYLKNIKLTLNKDDLVIPARGNSIGFVKIVKEKCTATQTTITAKSNKKIESLYVYYYLKGLKEIIFQFDNTAIPQFTVDNAKFIKVPFFNKQEQIKIAEYLDEKTSKIEEAVNEVEKQISLLEEYKKTLINDVVTGKIKVF